MVKWFVRLVVAIVAALFAVPSEVAAAAAASPEVAVYAYDGTQHTADAICTIERGPSATHDHSCTAYGADGLRSLGTLASPDRPRSPATYDYDDLARFVQAALGSRGASEQVDRAKQGSVIVERSGVAANAGSRALVGTWTTDRSDMSLNLADSNLSH